MDRLLLLLFELGRHSQFRGMAADKRPTDTATEVDVHTEAPRTTPQTLPSFGCDNVRVFRLSELHTVVETFVYNVLLLLLLSNSGKMDSKCIF